MGYLAGFSYILLTVYAICGILGILVYIFQGLAMHRIGKLRGIKYPWLAWIPVANAYNIGRVADAYNERIEGKHTKLGIIILIVDIAYIVLAAAASAQRYAFLYDIGSALTVLILSIIMIVALIVLAVFMYIALFKIYKWCTKNYVLFTVLSIIFAVVMPFLLFAVRNKVNPELTGKEE